MMNRIPRLMKMWLMVSTQMTTVPLTNGSTGGNQTFLKHRKELTDGLAGGNQTFLTHYKELNEIQFKNQSPSNSRALCIFRETLKVYGSRVVTYTSELARDRGTDTILRLTNANIVHVTRIQLVQ